MSGNKINCPHCGMPQVNGVPIRVVLSVGKKFQKYLCLACKHFVHVEIIE